MSAWYHSWTDVFSPFETCLLAYCAPCIVYGRTSHRMQNPNDVNMSSYSPFNNSCFKYYCLAHCCLTGMLQRRQRARIRNQFNLEGDGCNDYLMACCCRPCDLAQQDKEVEYRTKLLAGATVVEVQPQKMDSMTYGTHPAPQQPAMTYAGQ